MSPDKLLELSAGEPLVVRASIAIVDALIAENTRRLRVKQTAPSWIADLNAMPGTTWIHNYYSRSNSSPNALACL
jgi:hypothetical protein